MICMNFINSLSSNYEENHKFHGNFEDIKKNLENFEKIKEILRKFHSFLIHLSCIKIL